MLAEEPVEIAAQLRQPLETVSRVLRLIQRADPPGVATRDCRESLLVQLDVSVLSGLLAQELLKATPENINKMFFCNSGTEAVEAALKFARVLTGRREVVAAMPGALHLVRMGLQPGTGQVVGVLGADAVAEQPEAGMPG